MKLRLIILLGIVALSGCKSSTSVGETVPTPPRDLVEKSFRPPAGNGPQPGPPR